MLLLGDRVAVQPDGDKEKVLESGLILMGKEGVATQSGVVIAVGDDIKSNRLKNAIQKKDAEVRVMFDPYCGTKTSINGKEVFVLKEDDVIAIL